MKVEVPAHLKSSLEAFLYTLQERKDREDRLAPKYCITYKDGQVIKTCVHFKPNHGCLILSGECVNSITKPYYEEAL